MTSSSRTSRAVVLGSFAVAAAALVAAPQALADPQAGSASADIIVGELTASGFDTQINYLQGNPNVPLKECRVDAIRNPNGPMASMIMLSTVYVDVSCPNAK
jgi:hypothetical protein